MAIQIDTTSLPGTTIVYDDTNGGVAIDYTQQLTTIANSTRTIGEDSSDTSALEVIANALNVIAGSNSEIRDIINGTQEVTSGGIPIRDVYARLSYSTLVKVLEEEGVDINDLISRTGTYLDNARDN